MVISRKNLTNVRVQYEVRELTKSDLYFEVLNDNV